MTQQNFFSLTDTPSGVTFTVPRHLRFQLIEALGRQIAYLESLDRLGQNGLSGDRKRGDNCGLTALRLRQLASEFQTLAEADPAGER